METDVNTRKGLPSNLNDYQHLIKSGVKEDDTIKWMLGLRGAHVKHKFTSPGGAPSFKKENPTRREITHNLAQSIIDQSHLRRTACSMGDLIPTAN